MLILKQKLVNAVNFSGKRQPTVGLGIYVAKLDMRYEERIVQYCCPQGSAEQVFLLKEWRQCFDVMKYLERNE